MGNNVRVLLVEDDQKDALLIERALQADGHSAAVERVEFPEDVEAHLRSGGWDVLLAADAVGDLTVPDLLALVARVRPEVPVVILCDAVDPVTAVHVMRAGARDYLPKSDLLRLPHVIDREVHEAMTRRRRVQAEAALRESDARYRVLVTNLPDAVMTIGATGCITLANEACIRLLGASEWGDLFGRSLADFVVEDDRASVEALLGESRSFATPRPSEKRAIRMTRLDRAPLHVEVVAIPLSAEGRLTQLVVHDVTERVEFDRMKNDFIAAVSSDLRGPLTTILGCAALLQRDEGRTGAGERQRLVGKIVQGGQRMHELVEELLQVLYLQAAESDLQRETVDVEALVTHCLDGFMFDEIRKVELIAQPDLRAVRWDARRIVVAFSNLMANAVKFSPEGGVVRVGISQEAGWTRLSVTDEGVRITAEESDGLFEPATPADVAPTSRLGGIGLGLFVVKTLVEAHGGTVSAESGSTGATFTIALPDDAADAQEAIEPTVILPAAALDATAEQFVLRVVDDPDEDVA